MPRPGREPPRAPKITPWPNSTFALKTHWEDWGTDRHFWVYLERRAPGKYGRLEAMHGIVPSDGTLRGVERIFGSARYRKGTLDLAREKMMQAGVPEEQALAFMETISKEFPYPTIEDLFLEQINASFVKMVLGGYHQQLSYFRTGVPELTSDDLKLFKEGLDAWTARMKASPAERAKLIDLFLRGA
jgi:hypothetical protein